MKYHKIKGIEKSVCTAEQKIAYNLAFRAHISYQDIYDKARYVSAICVSDIIHQIVDQEMKEYSFSSDHGKYDMNLIKSALSAGLKQYLDNPFIASDYERIGKAFPANYI